MNSRKAINIILLIIALFLGLYFTLFQKIKTDYFWLGPRYLQFQENAMKFRINRAFSNLEFRFNNKLEGQISSSLSENDSKVLSNVRTINDNILIIEIFNKNDNKKFGELKVFIHFSDMRNSSIPPKYNIKEILIDNKKIPLNEFLDFYISDSNLSYYKAFSYQNISSLLAKRFGNLLLMVLSLFLLIVLILQILLFFLTVIYSFLKYDVIKTQDHNFSIIKFVDEIARDHAVFLGFLGTAISIWVALEASDNDYSNFFQILQIIKFAIFTTVEGLLIVTIFNIRESLINKYHWNKYNETQEQTNPGN
ncbi:MAG: hypothetical protein GF353_06490 [Candidatus Lokiarchaeota archaeon]|nr:hypothetical protein [Candidatus Lokiarchaeota archaeon]